MGARGRRDRIARAGAVLSRRPASDWLLLLSLVLIWGTAFLVIDVALESVPATSVAAARIVSGAALLLVILPFTGRVLPRGRIWWHFLALAIVGNCLPFFLIAWGQEQIESSLAGILMGIMPLTTLLLAHFFVPGEGLTRREAEAAQAPIWNYYRLEYRQLLGIISRNSGMNL